MPEQELYHYGVKGMQWGVRKNKYITVRQGFKNARAAGKDAWRKSVSENGGKLAGKNKQIAVYKNPIAMRRGRKASLDAYKNAQRESIKSDKAYNKQLRSEQKEFKSDVKEYRKLRSEFARSLSRSVSKKTTEKDRDTNTKKLLNVKNYVDNKTKQKGRDYVERVFQQANKKDRAASRIKIGTFIVSATAATVGLAYVQSKLDLS